MNSKLSEDEILELLIDEKPLPSFYIKGLGLFKPKYKYGDSLGKSFIRNDKRNEKGEREW
jgi:hypothetical protein